MLTGNLALEIKDYICRPLIKAIDFFNCLPEEIIKEVIASFKREIFLPKYVIMRAGSRGQSMFIIRHGTVRVVSRIGKEVKSSYLDILVFLSFIYSYIRGKVLNLAYNQCETRDKRSLGRDQDRMLLFCPS